MPKCCIVNCPRKKEKVTYHRFPRNETLKRKWLDIIGNENINPRHRVHFICSQHFTECSFNRTLDVVRLHDNSVPSFHLIPKKQPSIFSDQTSTSHLTVINTQQCFEEKLHIESSFSFEQTSESQMQLIENKSAVYEEHSYSQQNKIENKKKLKELQGFNEELSQLQALPPEIAKELQLSREKIKKLTQTCKSQRRKIKCLNERLRTRNKKITILSTFVKDFQNSHEIHNKQEYAGPKDLKDFKNSHKVNNRQEHAGPKDLKDFKNSHKVNNRQEHAGPKDLKDFKNSHKVNNRQEHAGPKDLKDFKNSHKVNNRQEHAGPKDLKDFKNSHKVNNRQEHAGPKDFFKRKIVKAKGLPLRKKYSEDIRKFRMTVNFVSPKGQYSVTI